MADRRHTLRRFPVVTTTSAEEAHDAVSEVYLPHALQASSSLRMQLNAARHKRFTLGFLTYGAQAELRMPPTETTYHVNLTTSGRTFAERGDGARAVTEARASGVVLLPDQLNTVRWSGDAEQLEAFVMTQFLLAVPNSYTDLLEGYVTRVRSGRLQPVLTYMENHADQPLTPNDLARVGCMSVRALHATFQQELGVSPMAHLRRIRLDHVHSELRRGAGPHPRISEIAMRWGFFHPSRFARQYHERFGELPSETGRRAVHGAVT